MIAILTVCIVLVIINEDGTEIVMMKSDGGGWQQSYAMLSLSDMSIRCIERNLHHEHKGLSSMPELPLMVGVLPAESLPVWMQHQKRIRAK